MRAGGAPRRAPARSGILSAGGIRGLSRTTRYLIIETMTPTRPSSSKISRLLFGALAYVSLAIGLIAIVVPGLPTTEFILLLSLIHI